jgi:hypothetical protein
LRTSGPERKRRPTSIFEVAWCILGTMAHGFLRRGAVLGSWVLLGLSVSRPAGADFTKCADADASAQALQHEGKLTAARVQLRACVDPSCPDVIRTDCAQRQEEIERLQPTVLFDIKDEAHHDVVQVGISLDGQKVADQVNGLGIPVDPGVHTFTFASPGHPVTSAQFVIREGEKLRKETIVLLEPAGAPPPPPPAPLALEQPRSSGHTLKVVAVVGGGVGVVGVALGSIFGLMASSALSKSRTECESAGACSDHAVAVNDYQSATTYGTSSTVAFIAGGALLAGGVTLFFTAPSSAPSPSALRPAPTFAIVPRVDARTGVLLLRGSF